MTSESNRSPKGEDAERLRLRECGAEGIRPSNGRMTMDSPEQLARLTEAQRAQILALRPNEDRMGGYGKDSGCPGLIERVGINHPVFGSHYRLTPSGEAVHAALAITQQGQSHAG